MVDGEGDFMSGGGGLRNIWIGVCEDDGDVGRIIYAAKST
jgi:hypothetical protein